MGRGKTEMRDVAMWGDVVRNEKKHGEEDIEVA
jgi:hypothetical protein